MLKYRAEHSFAWMEGHIAAALGQPFTRCPYAARSPETTEWLSGYATQASIKDHLTRSDVLVREPNAAR